MKQTAAPFPVDRSFGVLIEPTDVPDLDALDSAELSDLVSEHGAVLLRGFDVTIDDFCAVTDRVRPVFIPYVGGNTSREAVRPDTNVMAVDRSAPRYWPIPAHGEMQYFERRPSLAAFACLRPASRAGETTLYSGVSVLRALKPATRKLFEDHGIAYRRHLSTKDWKRLLEVSDRAEAERWLDGDAVTYEWTKYGLAIEYVTSPIISREGKPDAFMLGTPTGYGLRNMVDPKAGIRLGTGKLVPMSAFLDIRRVLKRLQVRLAWNRGDMALVDNKWVMHGRRPFLDKNRKLVARFGMDAPPT